jgi:hypothetical protein
MLGFGVAADSWESVEKLWKKTGDFHFYFFTNYIPIPAPHPDLII